MKHAEIHSLTGNLNRLEVIFGQIIDGEFVVSHSQPSRTYKTRAGAERAKARWEAPEKQDAPKGPCRKRDKSTGKPCAFSEAGHTGPCASAPDELSRLLSW